jgi:hypothetical protein
VALRCHARARGAALFAPSVGKAAAGLPELQLWAAAWAAVVLAPVVLAPVVLAPVVLAPVRPLSRATAAWWARVPVPMPATHPMSSSAPGLAAAVAAR